MRAQLFLFCFVIEINRDECLTLMKKRSFFSVFSCLDPFPQVFGQVKEKLILELHETIRVLLDVACRIAFLLFYQRSWQGEVMKVMENDHFVVFLAVFVHLPKFLG